MTEKLTDEQFVQLMTDLANAWSTQDTEAAVACFRPDAIYMEPPDVQLYIGHDQLRPYFGALESGTYLKFHHLSFNGTTQVGMGEYTFGLEGKEVADVGVIVVEIWGGKINRWREYQRKGPADFQRFIDHD